MAVDASSTTTSGTSVSSLAIALPTGYHAGQRAEIGLCLDLTTGGTYTPAAGWQQIGGQLANTTDGQALTYWYKNLTGQETATQSFSWSGGAADCAACCVTLSGIDLASAPILTSTINNTSNASPVSISSSSTTVASGETLVVFNSMDNSSGGNSTYSFSAISGLTNLATANDGTFSTINVQGGTATGGPSGTLATTATLTLGAGGSGWIQVLIRNKAAAQPSISRGMGPGRSPLSGARFRQFEMDRTFVAQGGGTVAGQAIGLSETIGSALPAASLAATGLSETTGIAQPAARLQASGLSQSVGVAQMSAGIAASGLSGTIGVATSSAGTQASGLSESVGISQPAALVGASGLSSTVGIADSSPPVAGSQAAGLSSTIGSAAASAGISATGIATTIAAGQVQASISAIALSESIGTAQAMGGTQAGGISSSVGAATMAALLAAPGISVSFGSAQAQSGAQASGLSESVGIADSSGGTPLVAFAVGLSASIGMADTAFQGGPGNALMVGFICNVGTLDNPVR